MTRKELINSIIGKTPRKKFLSEGQKDYYDILLNSEITVCTGPAGVGKSYIAMKAAVELLMDTNNSYEKMTEYFTQLKRTLPSYQTWQENLQTWARRSGLDPVGLCAKTTRKTWESWLMFYYPERRFEIALSQGHTTVTSLRHYLNMAFTDYDKMCMKEFVEGW